MDQNIAVKSQKSKDSSNVDTIINSESDDHKSASKVPISPPKSAPKVPISHPKPAPKVPISPPKSAPKVPISPPKPAPKVPISPPKPAAKNIQVVIINICIVFSLTYNI